MTNNSVIVTVGDSVPTVATDPNVPNKLRLVTKSGESVIDFQTLPPAPQILQVKNQYVKAGDDLTLFGRYFYFVDTVYFPGEDVFVTSGFQTNSAGTTLTVKVPEGLDFSESQSISVVTRSGGSATNRNTQIYNGKGMFADFDTNGALEWPWNWGWGISGEMIKPSQPGIEGLEGNFAGMNQPFPASYGWNNDKVINLANWVEFKFSQLHQLKNTALELRQQVLTFVLNLPSIPQKISQDLMFSFGILTKTATNYHSMCLCQRSSEPQMEAGIPYLSR